VLKRGVTPGVLRRVKWKRNEVGAGVPSEGNDSCVDLLFGRVSFAFELDYLRAPTY